MNRLSLTIGAVALSILAAQATATTIKVMDGSHDVKAGTVAGHHGLDGLGHTSKLLADSSGGWATAMASSDIIVVEQDAADAATLATVGAWVSAGNRIIVLGSFESESGDDILEHFIGPVTLAAVGAALEPFATTAAATGTTFGDDAATLFGLSSHHEVTSALGGIETFYAGAGDPIVFRKAVGAGDLFYIGWDYCCGGTVADANDWYGVLDSAIGFAGVPEPSSIALVGLAAFGFVASRRRRTV